MAVNSSTGQVYVGDAVNGKIVVFALEEPSVPAVPSESVLEITSDSATLGAEINPRSLPTEPRTRYRFEYGACASPTTCATSAYEATTPVASLVPSFEVESVSAHVQDLHADMTYHFRVLAENAISEKEGKPAEGVEKTFTTRDTGEFVLPDARQWEMVSPPEKSGALIEPLGILGVGQAAADGTSITYVTNAPTESEPQGYGRPRAGSLHARGGGHVGITGSRDPAQCADRYRGGRHWAGVSFLLRRPLACGRSTVRELCCALAGCF